MARLSGINFGASARALTAALLLGTAILSFSPGPTAYAARYVTNEAGDTDSGGGPATGTTVMYGKKQGDLTNDGYTCVTVATGFKECTKAGSPTYWCDASGTCEVKPFRAGAADVVAPRGKAKMTMLP